MRNGECGIEEYRSIPAAGRRDRRWFEPFRIPNSAFRIGMTPGLLIFAATYVLIAAQRLPFLPVNRPAASLLGADAMEVIRTLPLRDAYAAIDFRVLKFRLGLMFIISY